MTRDGRRSRRAVGATADADPAADERWYLTDEREFLRRSLEDADREHEAGDLSDEDHAVLVARDTARLAEVEAELAALGRRRRRRRPPSAERRGRPRPRAAERRTPCRSWRRLGHRGVRACSSSSARSSS